MTTVSSYIQFMTNICQNHVSVEVEFLYSNTTNTTCFLTLDCNASDGMATVFSYIQFMANNSKNHMSVEVEFQSFF